jgi:hypothetical protein
VSGAPTARPQLLQPGVELGAVESGVRERREGPHRHRVDERQHLAIDGALTVGIVPIDEPGQQRTTLRVVQPLRERRRG